ncbi:C-type mannose receptor 2 isoform X2 [Spea bombifrons]|uniref:C-type mannose receptor 2 isoform X2 n=1 Tax=Spea bombifrons TaxID=233779 RepID=UPI00234B44D2|nr:C-type mannose receptor 2 isoform X2 [Spea bombifrons]
MRCCRRNLSVSQWLAVLIQSTLLAFTIDRHLGRANGETAPFLVFSPERGGCLQTRGSSVQVVRPCNTSSPAQQWIWVSRRRLFNLGSMQCLWTPSPTNGTASTIYTYQCDHENFHSIRRCESQLDQLTNALGILTTNGSNLQQSPSNSGRQWLIYGTNQSICSAAFMDIYTIQGNSNGRPCAIPFKYDNQWFYSCTSTGREDGHLWCATTVDYGKDEKWGFCPVKSDDCEAFWDKDPLTQSCYQFNFQSALSWSEAWTSCRQQNAHLLSITEIHEQTYINGLLTGYSSTLWIGLNDLDTNGGWQWSDGSPLKFLNWESDQPNNSEENCAVIRTESSGAWQNRDCGNALPYICKKATASHQSNTHIEPVEPGVEIECDAGWLNFGMNCYRLNTDKKTWQEAKKACVRLDGNLASIHRLLELEFVTKQVKQDVEELWIGLNDLKHQMNFEWSDGSSVTFTSWHPFEPNNFRDSMEDCVTIWGPDGKWNDSPCNQTLPSICKKPGVYKQQGKENNHGCQKGWSWHSPSCYWMGDEQVTYSEAIKACSGRSARLLTVQDRFEQAYINSLLYGSDGSYYWTSLQDLNRTGVFSWLGGDEVTYTHWNRDQPGYDRGGCVALATGKSLGLWEVKDCTEFRAKYVCMQSLAPLIPLIPAIRPTPSFNGSCPDGWSSGPNLSHCYKVYHSENLQDKKTWISAQLSCREIGAQLLSISNVEEEHFVAHLLSKIFGESDSEAHEQHWFWIGLNRRNPTGDQSWVWSDGQGYSYHNFGRSNQDNDDIRGCVVLDLSSLQWVALECESQMDWICKLPKGTEIKEPTITKGSTEWLKYGNTEYRFFDHHSRWSQAQRICTWLQAELVSIHDQAELDFLGQNLQMFSSGQEQHWWIGLHTYENDGRFRWSDKSVLSFVQWAYGRPGPPTREKKCVYMTASRDWSDQKCLTALPYICKRSNTTVPRPTLPPLLPSGGGCPKGWLPFLNKCFGIKADSKSERKTWQQARDSCKLLGGELATVSNYLEQAFITSILPNITIDLWIGLHSVRQKFQWVEGQPLDYVNWGPGEPSKKSSSGDGENPVSCVAISHGLPHQSTGSWDATSCLNKLGFICQISKVPSLNPPSEPLPPLPGQDIRYRNSSYLIMQKPVTWSDARLLCETRNATLTSVPDPYQQAYLTMAIGLLNTPVWIGLANEEGGRSYSWLTDDGVFYTNWRDGEPQHLSGCVYMDSEGKWGTASCESKMPGNICNLNSTSIKTHKWSFNGSCPRSIGDSSWITFRNFCYSFHMEINVSQKEASKRCQKVGGDVLTIEDESENVFVWEHLQTYESQSRGAWLGMSFNAKGASLLWNDNTPVNYSNWGQQDSGPSLLSPNSCYWIQGSNGLWNLGSCTNVSMGVICKLSRAQEAEASKSILPEHTTAIAVVILSTVALCVLIAVIIYLYRRRKHEAERGAFESARYSRTNSSPGGSAEKNILVSDMEMNEQE